MPKKITVNGITFDSLDDMPVEVRRAYEEMLAHLPEFADRDRDGVPDIVQGGPGPLQFTTTVRKELIVNGVKYQDEAAMPPEVRQAYRQAIRAGTAGEPTLEQSEMKMSFQITGPGFTFGNARKAGARMPDAIEPASAEGRMRWVIIVVGACAMAGLMLWLTAGKQ